MFSLTAATSMSTLTHPKAFLALTIVSYLILVRSLRWRRYNAIHRKYQAKYEAGKFTLEDAQEVMKVSMMYDMPLVLNYSLAFALFKTYAIPTISKLLADTKELGSAKNVAKRYADTEILISLWMGCPISGKTPQTRSRFRTDGDDAGKDSLKHDHNKSVTGSPNGKASFCQGANPTKAPETLDVVEDPRAMLALARVNWLHAKYNIKNDDYLYTLGLFVFEPQSWAEKYSWRPLSPLEKHSFFIYWLEIGRRMGIKDIPETQEGFKEWFQAYESEYMVPAQTNHDVASHTTEELLHAVPAVFGIKDFARRLTICACEERVRVAMMQPAQPRWMHTLLNTIIRTVAFVQYRLCLPRASPRFAVDVDLPTPPSSSSSSSSSPSSTPTLAPLPPMHPQWYQSKPWYKPLASTYIGRMMDKVWVGMGLYDEMPSEEWGSEGFRIEDMGPGRYVGAGREEVFRAASEMYAACPIRNKTSV